LRHDRDNAPPPSTPPKRWRRRSPSPSRWLGFHNCDQDTYFAILEGYARRYGLKIPVETLRAEANEWSVTRGARSGRVAWQFIQDLAGRLGKTLD
jgi:predicted AAA+ superfamily ATPase